MATLKDWAEGLKFEDFGDKFRFDADPLRHFTTKPLKFKRPPVAVAAFYTLIDDTKQQMNDVTSGRCRQIEWSTSIKAERRPWYKVTSGELFYRSRAGQSALRRRVSDRMSEIADRFLLLALTGGQG